MLATENSAERILETAHTSVKDRLALVDAEVDAILTRARELGEKRAEEHGADLLRKQELLKRNMTQDLRIEILRSAVSTARMVLDKEIHSNPNLVMRVALRALSTIPDARSVLLRVNHEDVPFLKSNKESLMEGLERAKEVEVRADRMVARGGLIIQTESGTIDAQIDTQLEEIATELGV
jgi:flagellar assembly protein FliH